MTPTRDPGEPVGRRVRRWLAARPLRTRLVAILLAVVALALLLAGLAASTALTNYLVGQLDVRITEAAQVLASPRAPADPSLQSPQLRGGGFPLNPNNSYAQVRDANGAVVRVLPASAAITADPPDLTGRPTTGDVTSAAPFTVESVSGKQAWRVVALPAADGSGGFVVVAADATGIYDTINQLILWQLVIGLAVLVALGAVGYLIVRHSLAPLEAVEATAARVAAGNLSERAPALDPNTEVGSLAASFNTMVGNLESAFAAQAASEAAARSSEASARHSEAVARESEARMRQFVADASHELRTPLTSIRGYSELYRIGAVPAGTGLDDAMARIEDEAARMGLLVDDLLLLARLDQQRPMQRTRVDLVELAVAAVGAAQVSAGDRAIRIDVDATSEALVVAGDAARLRQVLDNLLGNALRYTPADTPITVRLGLGYPNGEGPGRWARIEVVDRGPGLSAQAAARVFERFYREDPARSRAAGGAGLGLAIVSAIVAAHGGVVELETTPGAGATFRVLLPA